MTTRAIAFSRQADEGDRAIGFLGSSIDPGLNWILRRRGTKTEQEEISVFLRVLQGELRD